MYSNIHQRSTAAGNAVMRQEFDGMPGFARKQADGAKPCCNYFVVNVHNMLRALERLSYTSINTNRQISKNEGG
ncbi:hypothetical protein BVY00_00545 [bacterium G20]|nr:hypothetical protein BVY00_00545 [bacterium G20]